MLKTTVSGVGVRTANYFEHPAKTYQ